MLLRFKGPNKDTTYGGKWGENIFLPGGWGQVGLGVGGCFADDIIHLPVVRKTELRRTNTTM